MKIYLAGCANMGDFFNYYNYYNFYRLDSFYFVRKKNFDLNFCLQFKDYILDSGAFSFMNGGLNIKIDWFEYIDQYAKFILKHKIKNYIELDIDKIIGYSEVLKLRKKLEKLIGYKCMPVWHISRGYDDWLNLCKEYNYICFGAFLTDGLARDKYYLIHKFLQDARKYNCNVHGLGFTSSNNLKKYKFYSVDSSTWLSAATYGELSVFDPGTVDMKRKYKAKNQKVSTIKIQKYNFLEWVKFSNYAEINL